MREEYDFSESIENAYPNLFRSQRAGPFLIGCMIVLPLTAIQAAWIHVVPKEFIPFVGWVYVYFCLYASLEFILGLRTRIRSHRHSIKLCRMLAENPDFDFEEYLWQKEINRKSGCAGILLRIGLGFAVITYSWLWLFGLEKMNALNSIGAALCLFVPLAPLVYHAAVLSIENERVEKAHDRAMKYIERLGKERQRQPAGNADEPV